MAQSPEDELAEFMAPLPQWLHKVLWHDHASMTDLDWASWMDSTNPFTADQIEQMSAATGWKPERYPHTADELRPEFERIIRRSPEMWKRYRDNAKAARDASADPFVKMPRGKPGRKPDDAKAARIWALCDAGKTSREMKAILDAEGMNLSIEAIEAYRKTRRRPPEQ